MLYLVGLGLADETDITVKGLEVVKRAERVYLEAYTSILHVGKEKLVGFNTLCPRTTLTTTASNSYGRSPFMVDP
jgi:diphthamide biosynthesis methyltransferase